MPGESRPLEGVDPQTVAVDDFPVEDVRSALSADDPVVRQRACEGCFTLAAEHPDEAATFVDSLLDRLDDESVAVAQNAAAALVPLVEARPDAFDNAGSALVGMYERDVSTARAYAAKLLGTIAVDRPELLAPHVDRLVDALASPSASFEGVGNSVPADQPARGAIYQHDKAELEREQASRETVANVIVAVAEAEPGAVTAVIDDLVAALDDAPTVVVASFLDAIAAIAESTPDATHGYVPDLIARLDHDEPVVRARAIRALGFVGDAAAVEALREVAESDEDEDVRTLAAETVDWLESA